MPLIGLANVNRAIDDLVQSKNDNLRIEYIKTFREIITGTPVDEGRARSNWFLSQDKASSETTNSTSPSKAADKVPKKVSGKKTFLTNNLPYIGVLEFGGFPSGSTEKTSGGFSRLAPKGWVRIALARLKKRIKSI